MQVHTLIDFIRCKEDKSGFVFMQDQAYIATDLVAQIVSGRSTIVQFEWITASGRLLQDYVLTQYPKNINTA